MNVPSHFVVAVCIPLSLLSANAAGAEPPENSGSAHIGDLELRFDASVWSVDGAGDRFTIACDESECRQTAIVATIAAENDAPCTSDTPERMLVGSSDVYAPDEFSDDGTFRVNGLTIHWAIGYLGCRNWAGGPVAACTSHAGKTYRFEAHGNACRTPPYYARTVLSTLMGLRPR